jgi:hypothetical protein
LKLINHRFRVLGVGEAAQSHDVEFRVVVDPAA